MERYLIFAGFDYYPRGGMKDYFRSASSINEAVAIIDLALTENVILSNCGFDILVKADWAHAYDTESMEIVIDLKKSQVHSIAQLADYKPVSDYKDHQLETGEFGSFDGGIRSD